MMYIPPRAAAVATPPPAGSLDTITFDGDTYMTRSGGLAGAADSSLVCGYVQAFNTTNGSTQYLMNTPGQRIKLWMGGSQRKFHVEIRDAAGAMVANFRSNIEINDGVPRDFYWRYDGVTGEAVLYHDATDVTSTVQGTSVGVVDMTEPNWIVGAVGFTGGNELQGSIERLAIWQDVALDVTDPAVRAAMADEAQAASLGDNILDLYGAAEISAGTNRGSGGDFAITGAFS